MNTEEKEDEREATRTNEEQISETETRNPVSEEDKQMSEILLLKEQLEEQKDKYVRLYADFDNYKKRMARERLELIDSAGKDIIGSMLPVLDDFERAMKNMENTQDLNALKDGISLIQQKLNQIMQSKGLKSFASIGEKFDVEKHEALTEIPATTEEQKGIVLDEMEKGYLLGDKIIRYAKVVVGK